MGNPGRAGCQTKHEKKNEKKMERGIVNGLIETCRLRLAPPPPPDRLVGLTRMYVLCLVFVVVVVFL